MKGEPEMANREWEFSTADNRSITVPMKGSRADAVTTANTLTELAGEKVYVQPKGTAVAFPMNEVQ